MSYVNAMIAIQSNSVETFLDNWRFDTNGDRLRNDFTPFNSGQDNSQTIDVYDNSFCIVSMETQGYWKISNNKQLISIYIADIVEPDWADLEPDPKDVLTVLHYLREVFPGPFQILEVFKRDGVRHGQTLILPTYDNEGNEIDPEEIVGQSTYPAFPQADMLAYMPEGIISQLNKILGWNDRRW